MTAGLAPQLLPHQTSTRSRLRRAGFVGLDATIGLIILMVLGTAFTVAVSRQHRAADRMSDGRGAAWAAEHALARMQAGTPAGEGVKVEPLPADAAPAGYAWVRVHTELNGRPASLVGLVPADAVPPATAPANVEPAKVAPPSAEPTSAAPENPAPTTLPAEGARQ